MSLRTRLFELPMPGFLRRACIRRLARLTAEAFGAGSPGGRHLSTMKTLEAYAEMTAGCAAQRGAGTVEAEEKLFTSARALGSRLRAWLGVRSIPEAMSAARALYRVIEVDFRPEGSDAFSVPQCYFSRHYSPSACRLISSLDRGLLAGLTGGREMTFTQRITEGAAFCRGVVR
jgi:hypothetical protein